MATKVIIADEANKQPQAVQNPQFMVPIQAVLVQPRFGYASIMAYCPTCSNTVKTEIKKVTGLATWLLCGGMCCMLCIPCCLIPFCLDECKGIQCIAISLSLSSLQNKCFHIRHTASLSGMQFIARSQEDIFIM